MREVDYTDEAGRRWRVRVPDGAPEDMYSAGIVVGPPAGLDDWLKGRGWPEPYRIAIHNALHARGLITVQDVMKRPEEVRAALNAVTRTDMQGIQQVYYQEVALA